ncbi:predicted protein [Uncinocarpus reesii 1704]|uniref:Aminoglycoside phosphotransferase domain-containing protein n=1 Tax=Uncinocarpus reesii (strain UAMH 1704) TaxID=336963 RepID=C4JZD0_UNCRE|nr:uncharacterized protein UREG_07531 [Uncinocarpus reesii 1704]EEP82666.1 predicted protein [Uncinocarpus reesii 1704]
MDIIKLAEGGFNRVFLLSMEDGFQAIAKIPYHIAVPKHYATASEAATLEFLHSKGVPVPKLYGYSASVDNPAGVEYLIMEKAHGVPIIDKWFTMTKRERHTLASSVVEIEKKLFGFSFNAIGSIYFASDVPSHLQAPLYSKSFESDIQDDTHKRFCIGPTADYMFWYGRRAGLDLHRGPWTNPTDYLHSVGEKELVWTRSYGKPLELDFPHNGPFPGKQHPDQYITLLEKYLAMIPYLLPKQNSDPRNQPTFRHPEPLLLAAGYPRAFENPDINEPVDLQEPKLPPEYDSLTGEDKAEADELYRRQTLFYYYRIFNGVHNRSHLSAIHDPLLHPRKHLVDRAGRQWSGNLMTLKGALVRMAEYWPLLPDTKGIKCPIEFSPDEIEEFHKNEEIWFSLNAVVNRWRDQIGMNEEGWISNQQYESAVERDKGLKKELIKMTEGDQEDIELLHKGWPFRDQEEVY